MKTPGLQVTCTTAPCLRFDAPLFIDGMIFDLKWTVIQYFSPYLSADMRKMAAAFNTTVLALEDELMQLILDGQIQARIDSHNKV